MKNLSIEYEHKNHDCMYNALNRELRLKRRPTLPKISLDFLEKFVMDNCDNCEQLRKEHEDNKDKKVEDVCK